jgi:hypothetical protein
MAKRTADAAPAQLTPPVKRPLTESIGKYWIAQRIYFPDHRAIELRQFGSTALTLSSLIAETTGDDFEFRLSLRKSFDTPVEANNVLAQLNLKLSGIRFEVCFIPTAPDVGYYLMTKTDSFFILAPTSVSNCLVDALRKRTNARQSSHNLETLGILPTPRVFEIVYVEP